MQLSGAAAPLWFSSNLRNICGSEHASDPSQLSLHGAVVVGCLARSRSGDMAAECDLKHLLVYGSHSKLAQSVV